MLNTLDKRGIPRSVERVIEEAIVSNKYTRSIYNGVCPSYYQWRYKRRGIGRYTAPCNPIKLIYINPNDINKFTSRPRPRNLNKQSLIGSVLDGKWDDRQASPIKMTVDYPEWKKEYFDDRNIEASILYKSMMYRFDQGYDWDQTPWYELVVDTVTNKGAFWHNCTSEKDVKNRCNKIDKLYDSIKNNGYRTQKDLHKDYPLPTRLMNEINVDISREGDFLLSDGIHRLIISKLLGIDKVPMTILVRHTKWMEKRETVWNGNHKIKHPDMTEFHKENVDIV